MFSRTGEIISDILSKKHGRKYPISFVNIKENDYRTCIHISKGVKVIPYKNNNINMVELIFPKKLRLIQNNNKIPLKNFLQTQGIEEDIEKIYRKLNSLK